MKKVKNQAFKTKLGHKRHAKAVARKGKTYNPRKSYYDVINGRAVPAGPVVDTTVLDLS